MSFCQLSSVLEPQQGVCLALWASKLLDEPVSRSSGKEESSLGEENSSTSDRTLLLDTGSGGTKSGMSEVNSIDSTP